MIVTRGWPFATNSLSVTAYHHAVTNAAIALTLAVRHHAYGYNPRKTDSLTAGIIGQSGLQRGKGTSRWDVLAVDSPAGEAA